MPVLRASSRCSLSVLIQHKMAFVAATAADNWDNYTDNTVERPPPNPSHAPSASGTHLIVLYAEDPD
jgi:hypothetical protein